MHVVAVTRQGLVFLVVLCIGLSLVYQPIAALRAVKNNNSLLNSREFISYYELDHAYELPDLTPIATSNQD